MIKKKYLDFLTAPSVIICFCSFIYFLFIYYLLLQRYYSFHNFNYDTALYSEFIYKIIKFDFYSNIRKINFFEHHFQPGLFFFSLLRLYSPAVLYFFQALGLAFSQIIFFFICKNILKKINISIIFYFIYFFSGIVFFSGISEFHPVSIALPFLFLGILFYIKGKINWMILFFIIALLFREEICFFIIAFSIALILKKHYIKKNIILIIFCMLYFAIYQFIIKPYYITLPNDYIFSEIYPHLGKNLPEFLRNLITNPLFLIKFIFSISKIKMMLFLFLPYLFLPLFSIFCLTFLPNLLMILLRQGIEGSSLLYHYHTVLIPGFFFAMVSAYNKIKNKRIIYLILFLVIGFNFINGIFWYLPSYYKAIYTPDYNLYEKEEAVKIINNYKGFSVTAPVNYLNHIELNNRKVNFLDIDNLDKIKTDIILLDMDFINAYVSNSGKPVRELTKKLNLINKQYKIIFNEKNIFILTKS